MTNYILDLRVFQPEINDQLYTVYQNKAEALLAAGFIKDIPDRVDEDDNLVVGIWGNPFNKDLSKGDAKLCYSLIKKFTKDQVYFIVEDMHKHTFNTRGKFAEFLRNHKVIYTYSCQETQFITKNALAAYHVPHHVKIYDTIKRPKKRECLFYGSMDNNVYPERRALIAQLQRHGIKVNIIEHPGYNIKGKQVISGQLLAQEIWDHAMAIASGSIYNYAVAKYYEIAAQKTLIVSTKFPTDHLFLTISSSNCEIPPSVLKEVRIATNFHEVYTNHNLDNYAKRITDCFHNS